MVSVVMRVAIRMNSGLLRVAVEGGIRRQSIYTVEVCGIAIRKFRIRRCSGGAVGLPQSRRLRCGNTYALDR